jgi:hypothetical protein
MRKLILTTALMLSTSAFAAQPVRDWQMIGNDGAETIYVDRNSVHGVKNISLTVMY